jgi:hypothetical protein
MRTDSVGAGRVRVAQDNESIGQSGGPAPGQLKQAARLKQNARLFPDFPDAPQFRCVIEMLMASRAKVNPPQGLRRGKTLFERRSKAKDQVVLIIPERSIMPAITWDLAMLV